MTATKMECWVIGGAEGNPSLGVIYSKFSILFHISKSEKARSTHGKHFFFIGIVIRRIQARDPGCSPGKPTYLRLGTELARRC